MPVLNFQNSNGFLSFDRDECAHAGEERAAQYRSASPFPHIVIDDFLDAAVLRRVTASFPIGEPSKNFSRKQEFRKSQFHPRSCHDALIKNLLTEMNGDAFIEFLAKMTGIEGLIPDPYFLGGGLHEISRGGHLGVHADFNIHNIMHVERRINVLVYLNDDWLPEYGGELELWDVDMKACEVRVAPILGRCVVFNTNLDSFHGHPDPLTCPEDRTRRSIATYYYTAFPEGAEKAPQRTTNFKARKSTSDVTDWGTRVRHVWKDWAPPALQRMLSRRG